MTPPCAGAGVYSPRGPVLSARECPGAPSAPPPIFRKAGTPA